MKRFYAFVIKEFRHLLRDFRSVLIIFGIPVIQLMLFGHVITTEVRDAGIAILDPSKDEISSALTNKILSSGYFKLNANLTHRNQVEDLFKKGRVREVILFEPDFGNKFIKSGKARIQIITDASDPNLANLLSNYTYNIINDYAMEKAGIESNALIISEQRMFYNEQLKSSNMFVPGTIALILMLISALMTSISISREKENGTMEILLVSPLRPIQIIVGKVIPYLVLSFLISVVVIGTGHLAFDVPIRGSVVLLFFLCLLYIILSLSIGIAISTFTRTQQAAMLISMVGLLLPTMLLSGFIFPIENMPLLLRMLSYIMPPRWFLDALKDIMLKGVGIMYIWKNIVIMLGMLCLFIFISVKKFKTRLE